MTAFDYVEVNGIRMFGPQASWATDVSAKKNHVGDTTGQLGDK